MDTLNFSPKLRSSYLVQRLDPPLAAAVGGITILNPFTFGGGVKNGGLSPNAVRLISPIWSFAYMGSAEFEWGIVPSCLGFLFENRNDFVSGKVVVEANKPDVYYICHKDHQDQIEDRLKLLATNPPQAKEYIGLERFFISPKIKQTLPTAQGWLDCSNGFLFFISQGMWQKTCELFEVKPK